MKEFNVRKAVVGDARKIAILLGELGYPNTMEFTKEKIEKLSKSKIDFIFVAEIDGEVVAFAHLHIAKMIHETGKLGRIMAIVVSKDYSRVGIGKKLMAFLEEKARGADCTKMELTSSAHRRDAHKFYKNLGYFEKPKRFLKKLE
jgi:N-acetylglutamate synthase-like GNAT family acetyltransferase